MVTRETPYTCMHTDINIHIIHICTYTTHIHAHTHTGTYIHS